MMAAWTQLFGLVSFELFGQTRNVVHHHGALFDATVLAMARGVGLPSGRAPMSYQHDPAMAPDSDFQPGRLEHLVIGNACRLLDARRTPLRVLAVRADIATFRVEVIAFEDAGATWDLPFEDVARLQFANDATQAPSAEVAAFRAAIDRVGGHLDVVADPAQRADTGVPARRRTGRRRRLVRPAGRCWTRARRRHRRTWPPTSRRTWRLATSPTSRTC